MLSKALKGIEDSIRVHKLLQKNLLQSIEKGFNFELSIYNLQVIAPYYITKPDWIGLGMLLIESLHCWFKEIGDPCFYGCSRSRSTCWASAITSLLEVQFGLKLNEKTFLLGTAAEWRVFFITFTPSGLISLCTIKRKKITSFFVQKEWYSEFLGPIEQRQKRMT